MDWIDIAGYVASGLVFCTFCMKTMIPLRIVAIASNAAFIVFSYSAGIYPVLILHAVLLPLNAYRLMEIRQLVRKISEASRTDLSMDGLWPVMTKERFATGTVLFEKGAPASHVYYLLSGRLWLKELDQLLQPGQIVGEIGVFSPEECRTATAICETDVELLTITKERIYQLFFQNPALGCHLTQLIIGRLLENQRRAEVGQAALSPTV
jgi:CRP/FNR family cyclic AMP-dependent transcriptional regulator